MFKIEAQHLKRVAARETNRIAARRR